MFSTTLAEYLGVKPRFSPGPDPQEGRSYGGGKSIVLLGADGRPFIFSFAHGEGVYRLVHDRASLERGLRTGDFRSHADFIAAMVDGIALNKPDEDFLHHLSANEVFPDVLYRASVSALKQAREEAKAERWEERREQSTTAFRSFMSQLIGRKRTLPTICHA